MLLWSVLHVSFGAEPVKPVLTNIAVYTLPAQTGQISGDIASKQFNHWAPHESSDEELFLQMLVKVTLKCSTSEGCADTSLTFRHPYKVRKEALSREENKKMYALQDARNDLINKYIDSCCYTDEEYQGMVLKLSEEERQKLKMLSTQIDDLKNKDAILQQKGTKTLYHLDKAVTVTKWDYYGRGSYSHFFVLDNLQCGDNKILAKLDHSDKWTERVIPLECPDYSH
jgi:hypothetical protein